MRFVSEQHIGKIGFLYAIIFIGVITFSNGVLFIGNKIKTLPKNLIELEQNFIGQQKEQLKGNIDSLILRIDARRSHMEQMLQDRLKQHVEGAHQIAATLYEQMQGQVSEETVVDIIKEVIRPIRFNNKKGYVFILALDGEAILYPVDKSIEGTNFLTNGVGGGTDTIENLISIAQETGSGFYNYKWTMPGDSSGALHNKISYVTLFEPLGWVIGTGEYNENLDALAKATVIEDPKGSMNSDGTDYFFVYDLHNIKGGDNFATMLINENRPDLVGYKVSDDYLDAKGKPFRQDFLTDIRENGESFVVYWYKKPDGSGISRKLSYLKFYPEWNWIVARGIYLDRLDDIVAIKKQELSKKVKEDIFLLCLIFFVAVTIGLFVAYTFSKGLQQIFDRYKKTQQENYEKLEISNKALEKQSQTDALTQIFNRGFFNQQLTKATSRAKRYNTPLSIILFDIDNFKDINDSQGHLAGDTVLKELSGIIRNNVRLSDSYARWGGEEFVVLAPDVDQEKAMQFAQKMRLIVEKFQFSAHQNVTCSFGVSSFRPPEDDASFLHRTDEALYQAKRGGKNQCVAL